MELDPRASNDPETLGLWGAVHKRLFDLTGERAALDAAVFAHEKGFYLKTDYYNGINLAFLLNVRAALGSPPRRSRTSSARSGRGAAWRPCASRSARAIRRRRARRWMRTTGWWRRWRRPSRVTRGSRRCWTRAYALDVAQWMKDSTTEQLTKLDALLADSPLKHLAT